MYPASSVARPCQRAQPIERVPGKSLDRFNSVQLNTVIPIHDYAAFCHVGFYRQHGAAKLTWDRRMARQTRRLEEAGALQVTDVAQRVEMKPRPLSPDERGRTAQVAQYGVPQAVVRHVIDGSRDRVEPL